MNTGIKRFLLKLLLCIISFGTAGTLLLDCLGKGFWVTLFGIGLALIVSFLTIVAGSFIAASISPAHMLNLMHQEVDERISYLAQRTPIVMTAVALGAVTAYSLLNIASAICFFCLFGLIGSPWYRDIVAIAEEMSKEENEALKKH